MAYNEPADLLIGDIPLAGKYGNGQSFINLAADEIDSQIGHVYITPVVFDESTLELAARARPAKLLLKKINILLASGRIILDMAAGGEDDNLHAYGKSMRDEALLLLNGLMTGKIILTDAPKLPSEVLNEDNGPSIVQEDAYSLVGAFYDRMQDPPLPGFRYPGVRAYTSEN